MKKVGIIYGGVSTEHEISKMSACSIIENLDKKKYKVHPIYIGRNGKWYEVLNHIKQEIENSVEYLKNLDVIFPVLHGLGGEDGTIQGMLEIINIPYVGCKVLASSIAMDKIYSKIIFEKVGIPQAPYVYIEKQQETYKIVDETFEKRDMEIERITSKLKFPMFVKPSNSGSSVGINKANDISELKEYIEHAGLFDNKILIEENIVGKEVECAVLGNEEVEASMLGEIIPADKFYSFSAKYENDESKTIMPAEISEKLSNKVRNLAKKAYKATDCKGLARVDFFVNDEQEKIYINEINTLPGFTDISMYPKLWEKSGISYTNLLDELISLAIED